MPASSTQDVVVPDVGYSFSLSSVERPTLQRSQVADLVQQHWGLQVLSVHELGSYEDRNYLVECATGSNGRTQQLVLKVHNTHFSSMPGFLESQNAVCNHLGSKGIRSPLAEPTAPGSRLMISIQQPIGSSKVRLLKFISGNTLKAAVKTPSLLRSVGQYLAQLDIALEDFWHPGIRHTHDWAITHVADAIQQFGYLLKDDKQKITAKQIADLFTGLVLPAADGLRKQVIHSDANENNVIVDEHTHEVVALIDWSDILVSWLVAEVAIAAAYVMLMTMGGCDELNQAAEDQALQAVAHLLAGYDQHLRLTDQEWLLLPVLMAGRLMQSTLFGHYTISKEPGNADYVMPDEPQRWCCLDLLMSCSPQEMSARLRKMAEASKQEDGRQRTDNTLQASKAQHSRTSQLLPVRLPPFKLELYLARYEHLPLQLSRSSCQPVKLQGLLAMADPQMRQQWQELELGYPPNIGSLQLRREVSLHYPGTGPEHVLSCVPNEGIFITMTALLAPGDVVVAMYPVYQSLVEVARSVGAHVKLWNLEVDSETGRAYFSLDALRSLMSADVKCLVVNLPHNPSGWLPTREEWAHIVDCAAAVDAWLFSDEIYRLLEQQPDDQRLLPAVSCYPGKGISLGGLSKAFGLQGLRAGWLVCKDTTLLQQAENVKSYLTTTGAITSELLAIVALRNQHKLVGRCVSIIQDNIAVADAFFARWPTVFQWVPPVVGSLCLPRLVTGEAIDAFCERAAAGCGVVLLPATVYDHAAASAGQHFRLGLGRTNFADALNTMDSWLQTEGHQEA